MDKIICVFNETDILGKTMSAVRNVAYKQSKLGRKVTLLSLIFAVYGLKQIQRNIAMQDEITKLKYEVEKLKQGNGD